MKNSEKASYLRWAFMDIPKGWQASQLQNRDPGPSCQIHGVNREVESKSMGEAGVLATFQLVLAFFTLQKCVF